MIHFISSGFVGRSGETSSSHAADEISCGEPPRSCSIVVVCGALTSLGRWCLKQGRRLDCRRRNWRRQER
jgi:hypothetical protein